MNKGIIELWADLGTSVSSLRRTIGEIRQTVARVSASQREITEAGAQRREAMRLLNTLTARQRDVLERVLAGHANKAIAFDLGVSDKTIETHRARLIQKFRATSFPNLVQKAVLAGVKPWSNDGQIAPRLVVVRGGRSADATE